MQWFDLKKGKRNLVYALLLSFAFLFFTFEFSVAATPRHYTELSFPPLPEVKIPEYTRYKLNNGMVVYLMEDHDLPLVSGSALIRTGDRWETADKIGMAGLTGQVMRTGGTKTHPADRLNQILEQRAASVETGIGGSSGSVSFNALSEDLEEVFGLFASVMLEPAFPQDKIDLAKTQVRGNIARRNDNPNAIASREFQKLIYGNNSPYARTVEYSTLENISREDLVNFYEKYFHPNNIILGIVGDFDSKKMRALIEKEFGNWRSNPQLQIPPVPPASQAKMGGIFFVNQPQLTQSYVQMGHLGGRFDSPDYAAMDVLSDILSGFGRRLFNEVRSRQGLAYSVYGVWSPRYDYPGLFLAGGQTRSETTVQFIQSVLTEIKRLQTEPVTSEELAFAKDSVLNSFVFNFQDPSQTLSRLIRYEYYGYPADFLFRYQRAVQATTIEDIQRVARNNLKPENIAILVVGNAEAIKPPLTNLSSEVIPVDIAIPAPKPVASEK